MPRLRMHGAIPPLTHTSAWCGTWLHTGTILPFTSENQIPQCCLLFIET